MHFIKNILSSFAVIISFQMCTHGARPPSNGFTGIEWKLACILLRLLRLVPWGELMRSETKPNENLEALVGLKCMSLSCGWPGVQAAS